jgi:hypothetical protein
METRLNQIKTYFTLLVNLKEDNIKTMHTLGQKIIKLKEIYTEFINNNKQNIFVFGLDSFHFQGKLIDIEYEDMKRIFYAITNRMYCEYFKLYKLIIEYISNNISDKRLLELIRVNNNYPVYKDLEPFKQYDFTLIQNLHEIIIALLQAINGYISNKDNELEAYKIKNSSGLNIDNFVTTFNFNIVVMREKLTLFVTYIEFFHKLHNKYLKRLTTKIQLMFSQIANDIQFEDTSQTKKEKRKSLLNNIVDDNIDKNLLHELVGNVEEVERVEGVLKHSIISNEIDSPVSPKSVDTTTAICTSPSATAYGDPSLPVAFGFGSLQNTDENIIFNIFPKIEDNNNIIEEISPEEPIQEPITEPIEESINVTKEDDDMSTLTIESSINNTSELVDQQEVIEPVKKKRAYKSRKKA